MPLYEFQCDSCGETKTELYDFDNIGKPICCKKPMRRKFSTFRHVVDFKDGYDYGVGKYFSTARERNNYIAEHGLQRIRS